LLDVNYSTPTLLGFPFVNPCDFRILYSGVGLQSACCQHHRHKSSLFGAD
jgi:hypothetical protein